MSVQYQIQNPGLSPCKVKLEDIVPILSNRLPGDNREWFAAAFDLPKRDCVFRYKK